MIYIVQNLVPILIATLAGLGIGGLVYRRAASDGRLGATLPIAFVAEFWLCAILAGALILAPDQAGVWTMAIGSAVVIWIGFIVPALTVSQRVHGASWRAIGIDCAHWLAVMVAQAIVLQSIGLTPPPAG